KDPRRRYSAARELADDLGRWLAGDPIRARPMAAWRRGVRRLWKHRRRVAALAVAVLATTLAIVGGLYGRRAFRDWQTGYVLFRSPGAPPPAEILDEWEGRVVSRVSVPTAEALALPAGEYRARFSRNGAIPETFRLTIERGVSRGQAYDVGLDDSGGDRR